MAGRGRDGAAQADASALAPVRSPVDRQGEGRHVVRVVSDVCFVDCETTGLDPDLHEVWEVALVIDGYQNHVWRLPVDLGRADPRALEISGYYRRDYQASPHAGVARPSLHDFSTRFEALTRGKHLAGAVISFDEERLRKLLRANGACPGWHYHLIDVEALAVGWVRGRSELIELPLPWDSEDLSRAVGVDPEQFPRHTALGDALWAKAIYEKVMGR